MQPNDSPIKVLKEFIYHHNELKYNVVDRNVVLNGKPINDINLNSIFINCKEYCSSVTKDLVCNIIYSESTKTVNPFFEFIDQHKDEVFAQGNLDNLIASITTDTANHSLFMTKWLVSLIGSIHGQHSPLMLVLCGGQNTGKTEWFRRLLPENLRSYYTESKLDAGKDDEILMTKKLIIVDDEMGGKSKQESKKLKELTSRQIFTIREPYGRVSSDLERLAVLGGTSNDIQILNDITGNRRLLPINVISINHALYNSIDKTALFMELYNLYKSGYNFRLNKEEIQLLNNSTSEFEVCSIEEELINRLYSTPTAGNSQSIAYLTNTDIMLRLKSLAPAINISQNRLGSVLRKLGFTSENRRQGQITSRCYTVIEM